MFVLHERTRRYVCRALFVALCLLPTIAVCCLGAYRHSSHYAAAKRHAWQQAIFGHLGLRARIDRVIQPNRGVTILENVQLTDPDGETPIARIRLLECKVHDTGLDLLASQPEIEAGQFARLVEVLHQRILRGPRPSGALRLAATEVTLHGQAHSQTFTDVRCQFGSYESGMQATISFEIAGIEMSDPAYLRVIRNQQVSPPVTGWQLRTGPTPLPCALFAEFITPLRRLGQQSRFAGAVWTERSHGAWNGEITGRFVDIDLATLVEPFPHKLSGNGDLSLTRARFRHGKIEEMAGQFEGRGGAVSRSLVENLGESLGLALRLDDLARSESLLRFQQCAFEFQMDATGLSLSGKCGEDDDVILMASTGPLLVETAGEIVPAVAITRALVPDSDLQVPVTKQTDLLLRSLPLPAAEAESVRRAYTPLRLRE